MSTDNADFDLRPQYLQGTRKPPPKPLRAPTAGRTPQQGAKPTGDPPRVVHAEYLATKRRRYEKRGKTINKTRNGGGFNPSVNPSLSINIQKGGGGGNQAAGPGPANRGANTETPGSGFMSNEDIHKFSEHIRKEGRKRAGERAMDAEQLEQVLRNIPDTTGSMTGSRMRARRVSRHLKRIAKAEQLIAKEGAALYSQFEREFEAELRKISAARPKQKTRNQFGWR